MNNLPPVSIFIVTYLDSPERGEILNRVCEVALDQCYPNFEVIVSENPGPVLARDALATITDKRLKIVMSEENSGCYGNLNRCLDLCSYDIIKPLCDDDLIHPDFLTHTVPLVDDDTLVVVGAEKYEVGKEPVTLGQRIAGPLETDIRQAGYGFDVWSLPHDPFPSATLFTRKLFRHLGGYDCKTPYVSDWDFFIEACLNCKVLHIPHTLCHGGVWEGSNTETKVGTPFFFPVEGLYTKFRIYHCKPLPKVERSRLLRMLFKEFSHQCQRFLKHAFRRSYRLGYIDYVQQFFRLLVNGRTMFLTRPTDRRS